jgi:hypothetical protein
MYRSEGEGRVPVGLMCIPVSVAAIDVRRDSRESHSIQYRVLYGYGMGLMYMTTFYTRND